MYHTRVGACSQFTVAAVKLSFAKNDCHDAVQSRVPVIRVYVAMRRMLIVSPVRATGASSINLDQGRSCIDL
jgi:hypothetical protein